MCVSSCVRWQVEGHNDEGWLLDAVYPDPTHFNRQTADSCELCFRRRTKAGHYTNLERRHLEFLTFVFGII